MVVNVHLTQKDEHGALELLAWLNRTLQTNFFKVEQTCSGAAYCQLMDLLVPGCIDLKEVKFKAENEADVSNNVKLLENACKKINVKPPHLDMFVHGNFAETFDLLKWFKLFFDQNFRGQTYDPVAARDGQRLVPFFNKNPEAVAQQDFSKKIPGLLDKAEGANIQEQVKENNTKTRGKATDSSPCSLATLHFISKHCPSMSASSDSPVTYREARVVLGQKYPTDIRDSCIQSPYCLYMYHGIELLQKERGSVILIGYFDPVTGKRKVRLLDVIQPKNDTYSDLLTCLKETLKKFEIPLANLAVFYTSLQDPSEVFSGLRALNPRTMFLYNLADLAGQACRSGIMAMELREHIQALLKNIHKHFSSLPASLKDSLSNVADVKFTFSSTSACHFLRTLIQKTTVVWSDLMQYFDSQDDSGKTKEISFLLNDQSLRMIFLFLSHVLQPLCDVQESWSRDEDLTKLLQNAFSIVQIFASSFLQPKSREKFLRGGSSSLKNNLMKLPREEMKIGDQAVEYLQDNDAKLTDHLDLFYQSVISFYEAVSSSMIENLPLSDAALRNVALILSPEGKMEVTGKAVTDLGDLFGICQNAEDVNTLTDEFFEYQFAEHEDSPSPADQSVEQHWRSKLRVMGKTSIFRQLILSLLAIPKDLRMESVFAELFQSAGDGNPQEEETEIPSEKDKDVAQDDGEVTDTSSYKSAPSHPCSPVTSDVIDLTEVEDVTPMETNISTSGSGTEAKRDKQEKISGPLAIDVDMEDDEDDDKDDDEDTDDDTDDDVSWADYYFSERGHSSANMTSTPSKTEVDNSGQDEVAVGKMVWGQREGFPVWPGLVQTLTIKEDGSTMCNVVQFGDFMVSEMCADDLHPYSAFVQCFCPNSFATMTNYKDAIFSSLQEAAKLSKTIFSLETDEKEELLRVMLDWAFGGFKQKGKRATKTQSKRNESLQLVKRTPQISSETLVRHPKHQENPTKSFKLKEVSVCLKDLSKSLDLKNGWVDVKDEEVSKMIDWGENFSHPKKKRSLPYCPPARRKQNFVSKDKDHNKDQSPVQQKEDYGRHQMVQNVLVKGKNIEGFCLSCGSGCVEIFHPLFEGGLCLKCKNNFTETLYQYDDDGYQSYCTVCCAGQEVILCGRDSCCRSYCVGCVEILVGKGTFDQLKDLDPWICYLCAPESSSGVLKPRHDWSVRIQEFFANDSGMAFEPHRVYPSIPANLRRPIRVLSLFDGIATGYLVLKDLGFKVEKYVASEVDEESIAVSMVNHDGKITYVDDVRSITKEHIDEWGPFDLLIGGSPCNDLSMVNPARKGLFEGTGRLFFEYYRLLNIMKPKEDDPRPFFWLFENVVFMGTRDKTDIDRFLECSPVLVDAVKVSPAHRARYFWGNLPGMNRPIVASQNDKLALQDCLEPGRVAKYVKVRTITTRQNSLKQGRNDNHFPISMNGKDDGIWITEMEKIFGFPKHYTDVKNMGRTQRQKVLGKSWSVPVIRHLFAPLKDYFTCDEVPSKHGEL